jgi:hypothetical protein
LLKSSKNISIEELIVVTKPKTPKKTQNLENLPDVIPRRFLMGGASLSIAFLIIEFKWHKESMVLGPEGPLVEELWDNTRKYALYTLTVSTRMAYTIFLCSRRRAYYYVLLLLCTINENKEELQDR